MIVACLQCESAGVMLLHAPVHVLLQLQGALVLPSSSSLCCLDTLSPILPVLIVGGFQSKSCVVHLSCRYCSWQILSVVFPVV